MVLLFVLSILLVGVAVCNAFQWELYQTLERQHVLNVTEGHMFASNHGPPLLQKGISYISLDNTITTYARHNDSTDVHVVIYGTQEQYAHRDLDGLCDNSLKTIKTNDWAHGIKLFKLKSSFIKCDFVYDFALGLNGTYCIHESTVHTQYTVESESWYNVLFVLCEEGQYRRTLSADSQKTHAPLGVRSSASSDSFPFHRAHVLSSFIPMTSYEHVQLSEFPVPSPQPTLIARVTGRVAFKNPYGFLPATFYGLMPFEAVRTGLYFLGLLAFAFACWSHRSSLLPVHYALLTVGSLALCESVMWTVAFFTLNESGTPYCCPYPVSVALSLTLQVLRQTLSRATLLLVSLGYGIVRPKLLVAEWISLSVITTLYFVAALFAQLYFIVSVSTFSVKSNDSDISALQAAASKVEIPEFVIDVFFLTWIHFALSHTIRVLKEFRQSAKLKLYTTLVRVIVVFVSLFAFVSVLFILDQNGWISWPWQLQWVQQCLWETLNFAIIAALALICRPTSNSRTLAYAVQLPTEDDEESRESTSLFDDEDDFELVGFDKYHKGKPEISRMTQELDTSTHSPLRTAEENYHSLPDESAFDQLDDEEEYGLE